MFPNPLHHWHSKYHESNSKNPKKAAVAATAIPLQVAPTVPTNPTPTLSEAAQKQVEDKVKVSKRLARMRMPFKNLLFFYDQMATLIDSGVTLIDSLSLIRAQEKKKNFKKLYDEMLHHINTGISLADSMAYFPRVFPAMQTALVAAGEKSGNLAPVMNELVTTMEDSEDFLRKIKGAMFYPVVLIVLALGLVVGMLTFVIPKIAEMYAEAGVALPALTQLVIDMSDFILAQWYWLLIGVVGGVGSFYFLLAKTKGGRLVWEKFVFGLPVVGKMSKEKQLMMMCGNMAMLLSSGVLISEAFKITEKTLNNLHYQREIKKLRQGIVMGKEVSAMMGLEDIKAQKFKEHELFPLQVAQMLHIGETTGTIPKMMYKIRQNYHKNIDYMLKNISTLIEPIMIFIVAALVGSILMAVMLPFFNIGDTIG